MSVTSILIAVLVICSFCSSHVSAKDCAFEFRSTFSRIALDEGDSLQRECVYRSYCLSEVNMYKTSKSSEGPISSPISSSYWIERFYRTSTSYDRHNKVYRYTISFSKFDFTYDGSYLCVINEIGNKTNRMSNELMRVILSTEEGIDEQCFVPTVTNIVAHSFIFPNGSVAVNLTWNVTEKQSSNIRYCPGSRHWRVKIQYFSSIDSTPGDRDSSTSSRDTDGWIYVLERRQDYSFLQLLDNVTYYQFLVSNQPKKILQISRYRSLGSHIYYFGRQSPPVIDQTSSSNIVMDEMSSGTVKCTARGFPPPSVRWIKLGSESVTEIRGNGSSTLVLNEASSDMSGEYYCFAQNIQVNPPGGKRKKTNVWSISVTVREYNSSNGLRCQFADSVIADSYCRSYLHTQFPIYINTSSESQEDYVSRAMTNIQHNANDGKCVDLAKSLLCHAVYPYCDARQPLKPLPRPTCMTACNEFVHGKCAVDAERIKRDYPSVYQTIISRCQSSEGGEAPECIPLSYDASRRDQFQSVEDTGSCVRGNGVGYTGTQVRTSSNQLCQLWLLQSPHKHPMLPSVYVAELYNAGYSCRNPGGLGERPWCYTSNPSVRWEYCDIPSCDTCDKYNGTMCSALTGYRDANVFIRKGSEIDSWRDIEEKITQVFSRTRYHLRPSKGCEDILQLLLCHSAFPQCNKSGPKELCSSHCSLRQSLQSLCPSVYREFDKFSKMGQSSGFLSEMKCNATCEEPLEIPVIGDQVPNPANSTYTCYVDKGINYLGNVSVTGNGTTCDNWNSQDRPISTMYHPELANAQNHCRNPGGVLARPWCYTGSNSWEYCNIHYCDNHEVPEGTIPGTSSGGPGIVDGAQGSTMTALVYSLIMMLVLFVLAIVGVLIVLLYIQRRRRNLKKQESIELQLTRKKLNDDSFVVNSNYFQATTSMSNEVDLPNNFRKLSPKQIQYAGQLGQGNFGIVFKGRAFGITSDDEEIEVAVKTLKEESSSEIRSNFIDEAKLMFTFDHPNILHIYGVCMSEMPYQMVFEYMDEGDLTQYLRSKASSMQRRLLNPFDHRSRTESSYSNDPPALSKTQLLSICRQIASGMEYLASKNHVHRDLACRNCLINSDLKVKIGDFGMSRNLYSRDYYRINGQAILPVRWMSPESLVYGKFSVEGDVWSFGVVMWEVFSFALQPYYGLSNEEVTEAIRHGKVLHRPDDCPSEVYNVMKECWDMEAKSRPTFEELHTALCQFSEEELDSEADTDDFSSEEEDSDAFYSETNSLPEDEHVAS